MDADPLFSVIIATYNRSHLIGKTIKSVLNQIVDDYEVLVIDDGSNDNTREIVDNLKSNKVRYFYQKNQERGKARNLGIDKAKGRYVTFLDSDDKLYRHHLSEAERMINDSGDRIFFHLPYEVVDHFGNKKYECRHHCSNLNKHLLNGNHLSCLGVFVRREILQELKFSENRDLSGSEDWLLWLKIASKYPLFYSNNITAAIVNHDGRSVLNASHDQIKRRTEVLIEELRKDKSFLKYYGADGIRRVKAHMLSYLSLHASIENRKGIAVEYFLRSIFYSFHEFARRRSLAIWRNIIFR